MSSLSKKKKRGFRYLLAAAAADGLSLKSPKPDYVDRRPIAMGFCKIPARIYMGSSPGRKR